MKNPDYQKLLGGSGTSGTATATRPSRPIGTGTGGSSKIYTNLDNLSNLTRLQQSALGIDIPEVFETDSVSAKLAEADAKNKIAQDIISGKTSKGSN